VVDRDTRDRLIAEHKSVKAAAVHVRTKFELILKAACERLAVKIPFQIDPRKLTLNALWGGLSSHKTTLRLPPCIGQKKDGTRYVIPGKQVHRMVVPRHLAERVSFSLTWVLNPLSHSESVERYRVEILDSIFALDELERVVNAAAARRVLEIENAGHRLLNVLQARRQILEAVDSTAPASPSTISGTAPPPSSS
jgi:hypothetical protein